MNHRWRVHAASVIGKGHIDLGLPCQDAFDYAQNNNHLIAVVCDGAGSANRSELGAKTCASAITSFISSHQDIAALAIPADYRACIVEAIQSSRNAIFEAAASEACDVSDLSCTVVGAVLHKAGGCIFHIGDGVGSAILEDGSSLTSHPENGEYANETYFVTQDNWQDHLRLTPFSGLAKLLVLMSDGAMPFAFSKAGLFQPFIGPVVSYLKNKTETEGGESLHATMADERTWKITQDDKSLLIAINVSD